MDASFVAILFTDLVDSSALLRRHGDERADAIRRAHVHALREAAQHHAGRVVKSTGDGLMVVFTSAVSAVRCGVDMQRASELPMRVGVHAGEPIADGDDLHGTAVHVASRICEVAAGGQVLVSDLVRQIVQSRVDHRIVGLRDVALKGVAEPVALAEVEWRTDGDVPRRIRVVIADDQQLLREGFRVILEAEADIEVVAEASDGATAVELCETHRPDVVLMDIRMPEMDGLAATERLLSGGGQDAPRVVVLTTFDVNEYVYRALQAGASGFLLKDAPSNRLVDAVRAAAAGDSLIEPSITRRLVAEFAHGGAPPEPAARPELGGLTDRERDVLRLVARGLSNAEIAAELVVAESTVKTHVARVLMKLGLRDRVQAVVYAYESGFVGPAQ